MDTKAYGSRDLLFSLTGFPISWVGFKFSPSASHLGLVDFQGRQFSNSLSQIMIAYSLLTTEDT